jgi:predicted ATP-binding protein involved in virulence
MLKKLSISNYALIDNLEIGFSGSLNILTGETGAGKSIILGALSLILGQRAESRYFLLANFTSKLFLKRTTLTTPTKRYCAAKYQPMVSRGRL